MGERQAVIYLSGPITGVPNYWKAFEKAEANLRSLGYIVLSPAKLPQGMTNEQYAKIDTAMINAADAVYFLPGWENSRGATIERAYCEYIGKAVM